MHARFYDVQKAIILIENTESGIEKILGSCIKSICDFLNHIIVYIVLCFFLSFFLALVIFIALKMTQGSTDCNGS